MGCQSGKRVLPGKCREGVRFLKLVDRLMLLVINALTAVVIRRWPSSSSLHADNHLELALEILAREDVLTDLVTADLYGACPCLVPLCRQSRVRWSDAELTELQWPPLVATVHAKTKELLALATEHAPAESDTTSLLFMLELVHCHARSCPGEEGLWLVPGTASFARSCPQGALLERCATSGDFLLTATEADISMASVITTGTEVVTISSGSLSNDELLLFEGWADENLACERCVRPAQPANPSICRAHMSNALICHVHLS